MELALSYRSAHETQPGASAWRMEFTLREFAPHDPISEAHARQVLEDIFKALDPKDTGIVELAGAAKFAKMSTKPSSGM